MQTLWVAFIALVGIFMSQSANMNIVSLHIHSQWTLAFLRYIISKVSHNGKAKWYMYTIWLVTTHTHYKYIYYMYIVQCAYIFHVCIVHKYVRTFKTQDAPKTTIQTEFVCKITGYMCLEFNRLNIYFAVSGHRILDLLCVPFVISEAMSGVSWHSTYS